MAGHGGRRNGAGRPFRDQLHPLTERQKEEAREQRKRKPVAKSTPVHITVRLNIDWSDYKSITETFKQLVKKLEELNISLNNHYPQRIARKILALASYHVSQENDDFLKMLTHFRRHELYSGNSFDKSMAIRHSKSNPPLLDFASSQSKPDNDDEEVSPDVLEQARAKLRNRRSVNTTLSYGVCTECN